MTVELNFDAKFDSTQLFSSNFDVGLLTKYEVKMAGYWSSFFCACLWTETDLLKDLLYGFREILFLRDRGRDKVGCSERAR